MRQLPADDRISILSSGVVMSGISEGRSPKREKLSLHGDLSHLEEDV
jgi:hypothetical protein